MVGHVWILIHFWIYIYWLISWFVFPLNRKVIRFTAHLIEHQHSTDILTIHWLNLGVYRMKRGSCAWSRAISKYNFETKAALEHVTTLYATVHVWYYKSRKQCNYQDSETLSQLKLCIFIKWCYLWGEIPRWMWEKGKNYLYVLYCRLYV